MKLKHHIMEQVAEKGELPKDIVLGLPVLTLKGNQELLIENYRGMIECSDVFIRVQTKLGQIKIWGEQLIIEHYSMYDMKIIGKIIRIEFFI